MVLALAFMPYFVTTVVGEPVQGQSLTAAFAKYSGVVVALTAPFLGAVVDKIGPRKPWLAASAIGLAVLSACLWIAVPRAGPSTITTVLWLTAVLSVLFAYTEVVHNSMMPYAAAAAEQARASGLALALGNLVGFVMIVFMLWAFSLPGVVHSPLMPKQPLFGLDKASGDDVRIVGPLVGVAVLLGLAPLLMLSKDAPRSGLGFARAVQQGVAEIWSLVAGMKLPRNAGLFLLGRMLYTDARFGALLFGGIYAAGVMKWGAPQLLLMGLMATLCGVWGGFLAGWMDGRFGPKRALIVEVAILAACLLLQIGVSPETILFIPWAAASHPPLWATPIFNTVPQLVFLLIILVSSVVGTSVFSSSRTMLTDVAPRENIGAFFGLYSLSGAATAWLAPWLVEWTTRAFRSQQAGMVPIAGLFLAGIVLLLFVRGGDAPVRDVHPPRTGDAA